jgi:thymidylate synthase (FAD)
VRSEKPLKQIIDAPYSPELVRKIIDSGHKAAIEFDYFIFGVEGYSRVTEVQLVRKRLASYMIKSGRAEKKGRRSFDAVVPESVEKVKTSYCDLAIDSDTLLDIMETFYNAGIEQGVPEEDLRYLKPQATEFKGIIGMNAHALMDWFGIRCCMNAQVEIRDMANKMLRICQRVAPDLFKEAGPNCKLLGYCPENTSQNANCHVIRKSVALEVLKNATPQKTTNM